MQMYKGRIMLNCNMCKLIGHWYGSHKNSVIGRQML